MLYNLDRFDDAKTIVCVEGERDADTVNRLQLVDCDGNLIVGTTTGGSRSWKDEFGDEFKDKRVIIMSDSDEAGREYANAIKTSLKTRDIQHCVVESLGSGIKDVTDYIEAGVRQSLCS